MKKVLIVDDEVLVRMGFHAIVDWESCGYTVVGDAANGEEAMEKIRLLRPDLVFTDLVMDKMDGFQLMKSCGAEFPMIKFIVLSSYNDFENVREAMRCGALDYVFKLDVKPDQLQKMLNGIKWENAAVQTPGHTDDRAMRIGLISHLIAGDMPGEKLREGLAALYPQIRWDAPFHLITVAIDNYELIHQTAREKLSQSDIRSVEKALKEVMAEHVILFPFNADRVLLLWQRGQGEALKTLQSAYQKAAEYVKRYLNRSITAVMSGEQPSLGGLATAHMQNEETLSYRYLLDPGRIHGYHPSSGQRDEPPHAYIHALEEALRRQDTSKAREICGAVFLRLGRNRGYPLSKLRVFLLDMLFVLKREYPCISQWVNPEGYSLERLIQRADRLGIVRDAVLKALDDCTVQEKGQAQRAEITQIIAYVRSHLAEEMSVAKAAQMARLSESYFSHIFKREVNASFIDWLNRERVLRARQQLCRTDKRVNEIAAEVGIDNANYFSILFKKITGKTPLEVREEYKKQHRDKKADL